MHPGGCATALLLALVIAAGAAVMPMRTMATTPAAAAPACNHARARLTLAPPADASDSWMVPRLPPPPGVSRCSR